MLCAMNGPLDAMSHKHTPRSNLFDMQLVSQQKVVDRKSHNVCKWCCRSNSKLNSILSPQLCTSNDTILSVADIELKVNNVTRAALKLIRHHLHQSAVVLVLKLHINKGNCSNTLQCITR